MEFDNSSISKSAGRKKKLNKKTLEKVSINIENLGDNEHTANDISDILNDLTTSCKTGNNKLLKETIVIFQELIAPDTISSQHKDIKTVSELLNKGFGEVTTALHIASQSGHKQVVETLLDNGSDP